MTSKNNGSKTSTSTTAIPQPRRLSVGETAEGLVTVEIQLRKYRLTVVEADGFSRFKLSSYVTELMKELGEFPKGYEAQVRWNMTTEVWAPLTVCSSGEVPNREQFLALPRADLAFWIETAKELGHEFSWLDGLNKLYESQMDQEEREQAETKKKAPTP